MPITNTVDTVNRVREINTNLKPITITTDAGQPFELATLTFRERLRLTAKLLTDIVDHPHTACHQSASASAVIRQLREDSNKNHTEELLEAVRIEWELKDAGWKQDPTGWIDPSGKRQTIDNSVSPDFPIERTATEQ